MKTKIFALLSLLVMMMTACDSLEDTYKDFAGDGPIRYPGMCKDVKVSPGWECLRVSWTLPNDPTVKNIIMTCISDVDSLTMELEPTATECVIDNLKNVNYTVKIQSRGEDGSLSLANNFTERPYTYEHEAVRGYTRGYSKVFFADTHLLFIMSGWDEGIERFWISYTDTDGQSAEMEIDENLFYDKIIDVPEVDTTKPVVLHRRAKLAGCPDIIEFEPVELSNTVVFNSDFQRNMAERYGITPDKQKEFAATATTVELDHSLLSFEDLLYFSNLEKVVLGKNHYYADGKYVLPLVEDDYTSEWVLEKLNEIYGTTVEQYGESYFQYELWGDYVDTMDYSVLPDFDYLPTDGWTISNKTTDVNNTLLENILDGDPLTTWSSWPSNEGIRTMALVVDMQKQQTVNGIVVTQANNSETKNYQPVKVKVEYSDNAKGPWNILTHTEYHQLGTAQGESTVIPASKSINARFLRLTVSEVSYMGQVKVSLADVAVY